MNNHKESVVRQEFLDLLHHLDAWGAFVDDVLKNYLQSLHLSMERIQQWPKHRVKDVESYVKKVLYRKSYENPLKDTTDKVGTRIVLLNIEDVRRVSDFIINSDQWVFIESAQDIDTIREHKPNEFTYQSNHFIIKPQPTKYDENLCDLLTCEIQVRTLLQHAYAETSHDTVYKKDHTENPTILRSLAVTMAFLETADEKIKMIYEQTGSMKTPKNDLIRLLKKLYCEYVPSYNELEYDSGITDKILTLFNVEYYQKALSKLIEFMSENSSDVSAALTKDSLPTLFRQPVVLLVFYAIRNSQRYLINNWPFTQESLLQVLNAMNISEDAMV